MQGVSGRTSRQPHSGETTPDCKPGWTRTRQDFCDFAQAGDQVASDATRRHLVYAVYVYETSQNPAITEVS